jgi:hypothetical protein
MKKIQTPSDFSARYDAQVEPASGHYRRIKTVPYSLWQEDPDIFKHMEYREVPLVDIVMPEDRFRALVEDLNWVHDAIENMEHFPMGSANFSVRAMECIVERETEEHRLRNEHPALALAYDKYLTLLRLCGGTR